MASDEEGAVREFIIKEEGEEVSVIEVNVDVGEEAPAVNDVCRFCAKLLRINGILSNSALIFSRTKQQHKSLADRLTDLGVALRPSDNRSTRMCKTCINVVERLERDMAILRTWKEEEEEGKATNKDNTSAAPASPESTSEKRDRSPPSKTPRVQKKLRSSPPPSQQSRRSVTQMHKSVLLSGQDFALERCTVCCRLFHCPLCPNIKPDKVCRLKMHLEIHKKKAIVFEDKQICRCHLSCRQDGHYHCPLCSKTIMKRKDMEGHLRICVRPPASLGPALTTALPPFLF